MCSIRREMQSRLDVMLFQATGCTNTYKYISHDGSMVLLYMGTWIPLIYPSHVSIYTSTMDPMGIYIYITSDFSKQPEILDNIQNIFNIMKYIHWNTMQPLHNLYERKTSQKKKRGCRVSVPLPPWLFFVAPVGSVRLPARASVENFIRSSMLATKEVMSIFQTSYVVRESTPTRREASCWVLLSADTDNRKQLIYSGHWKKKVAERRGFSISSTLVTTRCVPLANLLTQNPFGMSSSQSHS